MREASASPKSAYFWWVPETNSLVADRDATFGQKILDISMAWIEMIVEPDAVADDNWWESVALEGILANSAS